MIQFVDYFCKCKIAARVKLMLEKLVYTLRQFDLQSRILFTVFAGDHFPLPILQLFLYTYLGHCNKLSHN